MKIAKIAQILAELFPPQKTRQIELIWDDITKMRHQRLTYSQMSVVLSRSYEISVSAKHLGSIIRAIDRKHRRQFQAGVPGVARQASLPISAGSDAGLLDAARARAERKREKNQFTFGRKGDLKNGVAVTDEDRKES